VVILVVPAVVTAACGSSKKTTPGRHHDILADIVDRSMHDHDNLAERAVDRGTI
jgi:hypothetical protein